MGAGRMPSVETVTVLITDLVGSTGLESRIGPGAADELREEHFALLRSSIEPSGGRELKNTGDGLIVVFDSASQAVSCAMAMQQRFERRNRDSEKQLSIKVGISLGDATASDGDYFGVPVIEAARLCERAQGGKILAKEIVAHLGGGRAEGSFNSVGELELKGLPEAVPTVEVGWEPLGEEGPSLPLPPRLREMPPGGFVGRSRERARLTELVKDSTEGSRGLALISGEPGIGKTRLSTHTALEARGSHRAVVLYGRCDDELAIPYRPWIEALTHYVEHGPESVLRSHVERHGGELARMVPQLTSRLSEAPPPRETDPDTERYLLWGAVVGLLREASSEDPLVLVLDDLHWADKPTLLLLKRVVSEGQGLRALIIATYRESDLGRGHPLSDALADLRSEQGVERIALKGLDEQDVVEIMENAASHELDEASVGLSRELHRETDGNPFYTAELLRHLLESGGIYQQESGRWTVRGSLSELGLPESVREVLGRRVERLGEQACGMLSIAAVIGREFDVDVLFRVSEHSEEELLGLLEEAVAASVLNESASVPGRFSFAHALINHTLYEDLGTTRRARLHRRVAEALEQCLGAEPGARVSELAHHWAKATTAVDLDKAVTYARMAGERALHDLAPDEALRWFEQALELRDQSTELDLRERCEILIGLGDAQRQTGDAAYRDTLLEASGIASVLADAELTARAALANNRGIFSVIGEIDEQRIAAIEAAIELDDPPHPDRRARLLALQGQELGWSPDLERRKALVDEALALARNAQDARTQADVLHLSLYAYWSAETLELRTALVEELAERASSLADPALHFWVLDDEFHVFTERGELARAQAALEQMQVVVEELGQPTLKWVAAFDAAALQLVRGDLLAGERLAERAFEIGRQAGEPDAVFIFSVQMIYVRFYQGRGQEAIPMLEQSVTAYPTIAALKAALAALLGWLGRGGESAAILEQAVSERFAHVASVPDRSTALAFYAEAAVQTGDAAAATTLYELIEPWAEQTVYTGAAGNGHARMWLGLLAGVLGRHEQSDEHLRFACEFQEANDMPLWAARAQLGWAQALAARGETDAAEEHAARALELSREHGYGLFEQPAETAPASASQHVRPVRALAARTGRRALAAMVRGQDDETLERRFAEPRRQRALLRATARGFQPAHAEGFCGVIAYELEPFAIEPPPEAPWRWAIEVDSVDGRARLLERAPPEAAVTIHAGLAEWVRVSAGVEDPFTAMAGGRFSVEGDVLLAARLEAMFGAG
jgi:class 3 adenylate cyclase/tetratricopeptide (TPR) repeat protein